MSKLAPLLQKQRPTKGSPYRAAMRARHSSFGSASSELPWPIMTNPTPYEILHVRHGEPYSKNNFLKLVKMYHPDGRTETTRLRGVPEKTLLERYQLIVAAHQLLNDPAKRALYEAHGLGWATQSGRIREAAKANSYPQGTGWNNPTTATSPSGKTQVPIYMSNCTFAIILVAFAMLGGAVQYRRAGAARRHHASLAAAVQWQVECQLEEMALALEGTSQDARILSFLTRRYLGLNRSQEGDAMELDLEQNICRH